MGKNSPIFALIVLMLIAFSTVVVSAKSYSLENAYENITILDDGRVHVIEKIEYDLHCEGDYFRELYLQKPPELEIENAKGYCIGATCRFRIDEPGVSVSGQRELINELVGGGCGNVTAVFEYDVKKQVIIYPDTAQFFYKVWDEWWDKPTNLYVTINLPGNVKDTTYYVYYDYLAFTPLKNYNGSNAIFIETWQPEQRLLEVNLLMPKGWFKENEEYFRYRNDMRKKDIVEIGEKTVKELEGKRLATLFLMVFTVIFLLLPFFIIAFAYIFFGRERSPEEVGYLGVYEREPPEGISPTESIFFITMSSKYGYEELGRALSATMLTLVNKGAFDIVEKPTEDSDKKDIVFIVKEPKESLLSYEEKLFNFMKANAVNGEINLDKFAKQMNNSRGFAMFLREWNRMIESSIEEKRYADLTGFNIAVVFIALHIFLSLITSCGSGEIPLLYYAPMIAFLLDSLLLAVLLGKKYWLGRWTKEGRILNLKFENFKKYLADFSALEEHPPESVKIWDKYMAYAVALGVAEKTIEAMKKLRPELVNQSHFVPVYTHYGTYHAFTHSVSMAAASASHHRGGGFGGGGFGGGGGGGGGGAR